ncbi:MAG TPA: DUF669 domain-containing protein [Phycisphaerales bacterium]|nr:DUF669 domain-containing protein [Phycisphaerales bacterium]
MAIIKFDASNVPAHAAAALLAPGAYEARIIEADLRPVRSGDGRALQIAFELTAHQHVGRIIWARLHIETRNAHVQQIARQELAALCQAVCITSLTDTRELLGKHANITLGIRRRDDGDTTNVVRAYAAPTSTTLHQN